MSPSLSTLLVRDYLGIDSPPPSTHSGVDYAPALQRMRELTDRRDALCPDQLWLLEHSPVYTLGRNADRSHIIDPGQIPVVQVDRGGQVTYHGPGQLMCYLLADIGRRRIQVRALVEALEQAVIDVLAGFGIEAHGDRAAPGVYVGDAKIAALGLRVSRGRCYHGLCFNYAFDQQPFAGINPCGFENLRVTQLANLLAICPPAQQVARLLAESIASSLGYDGVDYAAASWESDASFVAATACKQD